MLLTHKCLRLLLGAAVMSIMVTSVHGQTTSSFDKSSGGSGHAYPAKPIRVIIPFAAGGATDVPGRILMEKVSEAFRSPVLVDNRPGASSTIGTGLAANAPPDG